MTKFNSGCIGISTNIFNNPEDILGTVQHLCKDFSVVEIELDNGAKAIFNEDFASYDSKISSINSFRSANDWLYLSVHAPYIGPDCDIASSDSDIRNISCNLLLKSIDFCHDIGGQIVTYHPGYLYQESFKSVTDNLMRSLEKLVPEATRRGVKLCLENTGDERPRFLVLSPEEHVEICKNTGTFLTVDLVHHASYFTEDGKVGNRFFDKLLLMMPWVKNIHVAGMNPPKHIHLPIGKGSLPIAEILDFLRNEGYEGNVIVEEIGGGYSSKDFVSHARVFRDFYQKREMMGAAKGIELCVS